MSIETQRQNKESREMFSHYDAVIVSPGFDNKKHGFGLHLDTRLRLLAAGLLYKEGYTSKIVVGGAKLGKMKDSFANLMKDALTRKYKIPENDIVFDEYTFDTATQLKWIIINRRSLGENVAIVTDSQQKKHISALMEGFSLKDVDIISSEDVVVELIERNEHISQFINRLHESTYWKYWQVREASLTLFTQKVDKRGERLGSLTKRRLKSD